MAGEEERDYECIKVEGPKNTLHRTMYEIKMTIWMAWKLMCEDEWYLTTKVNFASGFHDLVLKRKIDNKDGETSQDKFCLVQIRYCKSSSIYWNSKPEKINVNTLSSTDNEKEFSLIKLFEAYQRMMDYNRIEFRELTANEIENVIIFSNKSISNDLNFFIQMDHVDEIIGFDGQGKQYRINTHMIENEQDIMMSLRRNCSDDGIIRDFLEKLVFMVDQPLEPKLEELIIEKMSEVFNMPQIFYNNLYKEIIDRFQLNEDCKVLRVTKWFILECLLNTRDMLRKILQDATQETFFLVSPSNSSELSKKLQRLILSN